MAGSVHVRMSLSSGPENVPVIRQALRGFADSLGLGPVELNDVSTALTEACNNASLYAYDGGDGPLEVELSAAHAEIAVSVRDRGVGLPALDGDPVMPADGDGALGGIGLPVIHGLAKDVRLSERSGGGTEVAMVFVAPSVHADGVLHPAAPERGEPEPRHDDGAIELVMSPAATAQHVLARVLRAITVRLRFSVEDVQTLLEAADTLIASPAGWSESGRVRVRVAVEEANVAFKAGPMRARQARSLAAAVRRSQPGVEVLLADELDGQPTSVLVRAARGEQGGHPL